MNQKYFKGGYGISFSIIWVGRGVTSIIMVYFLKNKLDKLFKNYKFGGSLMQPEQSSSHKNTILDIAAWLRPNFIFYKKFRNSSTVIVPILLLSAALNNISGDNPIINNQ